MKNELTERERVKVVVENLRAACFELAIKVTPDLRVGASAAAKLLDYHPDTLKNMRSLRQGPTYYHHKVGRSRVSYRLEDLAIWIEEKRKACDDPEGAKG